MADIQGHFEKFHETIRVDYEMAQELRDRRDIVIEKVKKYLKEQSLPGMTVLHQGSYKMKTGVKPISDLEYDIDVGLRFGIPTDAYAASVVRGWIHEAVKEHTQRIEEKGPCVRVAYEKGFHIDLVAYSVWEREGRDICQLAHIANGWRPADPPALIQYVDDYRAKHFTDTDDSLTSTDQFRRCVRYLRRWNDVRLPRELKGKPTGLALVILAIQHGVTGARFADRRSDDLRCLHVLCQNVAGTVGRLKAVKPTPENEDLFGRLSDKEMATLIADFGTLRDALRDAGAVSDPVVACRRLREVFGDDFPVPDPKDTAKKTGAPAIIRSSTSA